MLTTQSGRNSGGEVFYPTTRAPHPAVILIPGCTAAADAGPAEVLEPYTAWGERLAAAGYVALLVGGGSGDRAGLRCGEAASRAAVVMERVAQADAAYRLLERSGRVDMGRVGLMGWSQGADGVLAAVDDARGNDAAGPYKAAITFYPDCALGSTWKPQAPVMMLFGNVDSWAPVASCASRAAHAQGRTAPSIQLLTYAAARAGFDAASADSKTHTAADFRAKLLADMGALNLLNRLLSAGRR